MGKSQIEEIPKEPIFAFVVFISIVATIGGFLFGFDSGVINGTVRGLVASFGSDSATTGFNVASMLLGCAVGAFFAGTIADKIGRRPVLLIAGVFFAVSAWGSGAAGGSGEFIIYRILGGLAVGAASVIAPAYVSEVTPARYRGRLASLQQIAIISGLFTAFLSNYLIASQAGGATSEYLLGYEAWRWMFWVELVPAIIFLAALLFIPESPRYLVANHNKEKALAVLQRLMNEGAVKKIEEIEASLANDHHRPRLHDIIDSKFGIRPIVWLGILLAAFQQLSGINIVFYYGAVLWQAAGFGEEDALLINVMSGAISIIACIGATLFIDKLGRKPLLLFGSIGMSVLLTLLAVTFATAGTDAAGNLQLEGIKGPVALVCANFYVLIFNLTWGPVVWVLLGEIFPNQVRGSGLAVSGLALWTTNFLITITFPVMLAGVGLGFAYGFYAFCAGVSTILVFFLVKETKGKELEQM